MEEKKLQATLNTDEALKMSNDDLKDHAFEGGRWFEIERQRSIPGFLIGLFLITLLILLVQQTPTQTSRMEEPLIQPINEVESLEVFE